MCDNVQLQFQAFENNSSSYDLAHSQRQTTASSSQLALLAAH